MTDHIPRTEGARRSRLETWLVRELQSGRFEGLPAYRPLRGDGQRPELYARRLLAGLENLESSDWEQGRLRDDGRAFRSWAEAYPPVAVPAS